MQRILILIVTLVLVALPALGASRAGPVGSTTTLDYIDNHNDDGNTLLGNGVPFDGTLSATEDNVLIAGDTAIQLNTLNDDGLAIAPEHRAQEVTALVACSRPAGASSNTRCSYAYVAYLSALPPLRV